jgi:hypothetical protein
MLRSSSKIGLVFITSTLAVMGFDAYRDYRTPKVGNSDYGDFSSSTTRPSSYYSNGVHYHSFGTSGYYSDDYHGSSSGSGHSSSSSMSHTSRGGFGSSGHGGGS